jgi:hypothetical protein
MEQIWDTSFSSIVTTDWAAWAANNGCNTLDSEQVNVTFAYPEGETEEFLQATVTVAWQTKSRPMSVRLVTLKTAD